MAMHRNLRHLATLAFLAALAGCAFSAGIKTTPTVSEQAKARAAAQRGINEIDFGLTVVDGVRPLLTLAPVPATVKRDVLCSVVSVVGFKNASPADVQTAQQTCNMTIPEYTKSPLALASAELLNVASCASLSTTVASVRRLIDPLIAKLEASKETSLLFAAISIRSGMAFIIGFRGAESCG